MCIYIIQILCLQYNFNSMDLYGLLHADGLASFRERRWIDKLKFVTSRFDQVGSQPLRKVNMEQQSNTPPQTNMEDPEHSSVEEVMLHLFVMPLRWMKLQT